ncbi:SDR family oxidoreductase [Enterococcus sp. AZ109]|uniref:SDR family oxidoreductase n=1 Tax=Enterococcus sp. AZ109 TaxID=2774634 RepID=UPI003F290060
MKNEKKVVVLLGGGSMGIAIARRVGTAKTILIGDTNESNLERNKAELESSGFEVVTKVVDASSQESIKEFARTASELGKVMNYIHTAGLSPNQASARAVLDVDLIGTSSSFGIEEFGKIIAEGGSGLVISSMAGHMLPSLSEDQNKLLAMTPSDELKDLELLNDAAIPNSGSAYSISKRAYILRVQAQSMEWGKRGARINSISPGIIITPLALDELNSPAKAGYEAFIQASPTGRVGTPDEVATLGAYLLSDDAGFITGSDILIDGGVIAAMKTGAV